MVAVSTIGSMLDLLVEPLRQVQGWWREGDLGTRRPGRYVHHGGLAMCRYSLTVGLARQQAG